MDYPKSDQDGKKVDVSTYLLHKWCVRDTPNHEYGSKQTKRHIVKLYPNTRFENVLEKLHAVESNIIN